MLLRLQRYDFSLVYKPGTQIVIAGTLSRAFPENSAIQTPFAAEIATLVDAEQVNEFEMIASNKTIQLLHVAAAQDDVYQLLRQQIQRGWLERAADVPIELREYYTFADELTTVEISSIKDPASWFPRNSRRITRSDTLQSHWHQRLHLTRSRRPPLARNDEPNPLTC